MDREPHMVKCINHDCGKQFDISGGYITLHICPDCLKKPKPPAAYIEKGGLFIPNPEASTK